MIAAPIEFVVPGPPAVKGSTLSFFDRGRIVTKTDSKNGRAWARSVAWIAKSAGVRVIPKGHGVIVSIVYEFQPPLVAKRSEPCVRPDVDKLARALLDALTGVAYEDDGQVVALTVRKTYGADTLTRIWVDRS
jgi:Holliday junction resolvase RusA-like endonuclease